VIEYLNRLVRGESLSEPEAARAMELIMRDEATPIQIAGFITALRVKGETVDEIAGMARTARELATPIQVEDAGSLLDTCGTGGDGSGSLNISTLAAIVAAACGARVAKHGNRASSSTCGSADVLEALGVNIGVDAGVMKLCLDEIGICFLFAPALHKAMKYAIGPRKEIGIRTIFNILGPLTNPSLARAQLLGVFSPELTDVMAMVLKNLGSSRAYVVHGMDNLDEITITAETRVAEVANGAVSTYTIKPEDFGFSRHTLSDIAGGTAQENAAIIKEVLGGKKGPRRDIVVLNAGFAIAASGIAKDPKQGIVMAQKAIDGGMARKKLERLVEKTGGK
jgi:anthranilate phosphoribosyltransferase